MSNVIDRRTDEKISSKSCHHWGVVTDKALSGWGLAPRKSYYAVPIYGGYGGIEAKLFKVYAENKSDFIRARINRPNRLPLQLRKGDHLTIDEFPWSFLEHFDLIKPNVNKNELERFLENGYWLSDKAKKILQNVYK